jgi:small conductance mechanosensitive channel
MVLPWRGWLQAVLSLLLVTTLCAPAAAQVPPEPAPAVPEPETQEGPQAGGAVRLQPVASDGQIRDRLQEILRATGGLDPLAVQVDAGVVFLEGRARKPQYVELAAELARNTEGVVAVVNDIDLVEASAWDLAPAREELRVLGRELVAAIPLVGIALVVMAAGWGASRLAVRLARPALRHRLGSGLLREVAARSLGILVFLLGLYLALRLCGLTRLAATVIGGTGLVGLVVGIAFRGITENFLASLFLSLQQPFRDGDLVEIQGNTGYVQRLTSRTTVLMTLDGTQVQIPNAIVFASVLHNYTSSPDRREDFVVGIGYDAAVPQAQELALRVLREHPAVLDHPEPWVLVDKLGTSTVDLRVYFWLDGTKHSWLKVRSSVIRLVKRALQDGGVSLPDEAREVVFPEGIQITWPGQPSPPLGPRPEAPPEAPESAGEGGLHSEAAEISEQGRRAWSPDSEENLLEPSRET